VQWEHDGWGKKSCDNLKVCASRIESFGCNIHDNRTGGRQPLGLNENKELETCPAGRVCWNVQPQDSAWTRSTVFLRSQQTPSIHLYLIQDCKEIPLTYLWLLFLEHQGAIHGIHAIRNRKFSLLNQKDSLDAFGRMYPFFSFTQYSQVKLWSCLLVIHPPLKGLQPD